MARGVNAVFLLGNLGRDPEIRFTQNGTPCTRFSLAVTTQWGENEHTEWARVVAFGKLAEICEQYLSKGDAAVVQGRMQTRSWEDKTGNVRYLTEVIANEVTFLGRRADSAPRKGEPAPAPTNNEDGDDIPF